MKHNIDNQILRKLNMTRKKLYNSSARSALWLLLLMAIVVGSTTTSMAGVVIKGNVYGGGNAADVGTDATVNISAGQIGDTQIDDEHGNVFGGGKGQVTTVVGDVKVNIGKKVTIDNEQEVVSYSNNDKVTIKGSIYGGSALGAVNGTKANNWDENHLDRISATSNNKTTEVNICAGVVNGNVYGGGRGALAVGTEGQTGYIAPIEAKSFGAVDVSIGIATASAATTTPVIEGSVYGGSNINGTLESSARLDIISGTIGKENTSEGDNPVTTITGGNVHGGGFGQPTLVKGSVIVNIGVETNATPAVHYGYASILADVYGGSAKGNVNATATENNENPLALTTGATTQVNLYGGTVSGDLYGGGLGDNTTNAEIAANVYGPVTVSTKDGTVRNVFGCNNLYGAPKSTVNVNIDGGTISNDVYGGGNLANTTASPNVSVTNGTVSRDVYGGGALANTGGSTVNITGGTITRDIYGGGLGDANHAAAVNGAVLVNIGSMQPGANEGDAPTYSGNATIGGSVYGCNNANGSPKDDVMVNIYMTAQTTTQAASYTTNDNTNGAPTYAISQVFGGGNQAAYDPDTNTKQAIVHVYSCLNTIENIYGGGNAADATKVNVIIDGGRFYRVFGGGNGYSQTGNHDDPNSSYYNPGAKITVSANTQVHGGHYHQVFGGSNQYGDVASASLTLDTQSSCGELFIDESFGGANEADITGDVSTTLTCSATSSLYTIGSFYGGSNMAEIKGNVTLNVYGGTYTNVFGGSKGVRGGTAANIMDNPNTNDITEGNVTLNLYGGTIENAFGGSDANGNITGKITVNMLDRGGDCALTVHNIYGGGREAAYTPTTPGAYPEVNLIHGTVSQKNDGTCGNVFGGGLGNTAIVYSNPTVNVGYVSSMSTLVTSLLPADTQLTTASVLVEGNVYGGGEEAAVAKRDNVGGGNTAVTVQQGTPDATTTTISTTVNGDVYGGGALANVGTDANNTTQVTVTGGTITGDVYGGGLGRIGTDDIYYTQEQADAYNEEHELTEGDDGFVTTSTIKTPAVDPIAASVNGAVTVTVNGGTASNIYGCNNYNGSPTSTVTVNINNNVSGNVFGGGNLATASISPVVNINTGTIAQVFGGGNEAGVGGSTVYVTGGTITTGLYGGCNTSGTVSGNIVLSLTGGTIGATGSGNQADVYGGGLGSATTTTGNIDITLNGTTVYGDIYGGSALGSVNASTSNTSTITLSTATLYGSVFGGGKGDNASEGTGHNDVTATSNGNATVNINTANTNLTGIYGGANVRGNVKGAIAVNINANVGATGNGNSLDIFGGGYGANTNTEGNVTVTIGDAEGTYIPVIYGDIYGGSALGNVNNEATDLTKIDFLNGTLHGNIYGGGLGDKASLGEGHNNVAAKVNGQVQVNISNSTQTTANCYIDLREANIYGCNNTNGSPQDNVTVNIYKTAYNYTNYSAEISGNDKYKATYTTAVNNEDPDYAINQVFGGGNQADYAPENGLATSTKKTTVNIIGCNNTIRRVFSGGNAAAATGVALVIDGGRFDYVFGGGNGESSPANIGTGGTNLIVHGGNINTLFGGSNTSGTITGTMGINVDATGACASDMYIDEFFCGNNLANIGTAETSVDINATIGCGTRFGSVYGGCNQATIYGNVHLTIEGGTMEYVYGGSKGNAGTAANINGNVVLDITGGDIDNVFGGSNINGNITGSITVNIEKAANPCVWEIGNVYGASNLATYTPTTPGSYPAVNIKHGTVTNSVFGGGKGDPNDPTKGVVTSNPVVTIGDLTEGHESYVATVSGDVYGGGDAAAVIGNTSVLLQKSNSSVRKLFGGGNAAGVNINSSISNTGNTTVEMTAGTVSGGVYGGCNTSGTVEGNTSVNLNGGTIGAGTYTANTKTLTYTTDKANVHGGGYGENTYVKGNVNVNIGSEVAPVAPATNTTYSGTVVIWGDVYGGSALGNVNAYMSGETLTFSSNNNTNVNLNKGTVNGDVYGGGLGDADHAAYVGGGVNVNLHEVVFNIATSNLKNDDNDDVECATSGRIFGCNNKKGTPKGHVIVHVFNTEEATGSTYSYDLAAVFGGGNEADYDPTSFDFAEVIIEGCGKTSINDVYGGGNAASVPATKVWIFGTDQSKKINHVFGGGNGELGASHAAHVGFHRVNATTKSNYNYTGVADENYKTDVILVAGTINDVYGGSNSNGDIRGGTNVKTTSLAESEYTGTPDCCNKLVTQHIYGGGSQAEMSGDVNVILECMPEDYVEAVYGGAANATINGNVSLTVTSGKFGRVFGGNNDGGSINGTITVNVYEDGCDPLIIGELYGAGNNAPYSIYGCTPPAENSPEGTPWTPNTEVPEGNEPYVSVNDNAVTVNVFSCTSIGKVYGGGKGSSATVIGNTHVWINMLNGIINGTAKTKSDDNYIGKIGQVFGGGSAADVIGSTTIDIGTATVYTDENSVNKELIGVNIVPGDDYLSPTSNTSLSITDAGIYGGGEAANVDGNTTLNIGTKNLSEHTNITGNIFGGGLGSGTHVTGNVTVNIGADNGTASAHNYVGYANITGDVYGGSAKGKVNSYLNDSDEETLTTGATTQVNFYGGTISGTGKGNIYGGGLGDATYAADVYGAVTVNVKGGSANNVFGCNNKNGTPKSTVVVNIDGGRVYKSVYGGGNLAIMDGSPVVNVTAGTIGTDNEGRAEYGNVYGGGLGDLTNPKSGLVKGNTTINISGGTILHNIYGGGAYGSVGTYVYYGDTDAYTTEYNKYKEGGTEPDATKLATLIANKDNITGYTSGGLATINITGGTIGTTGIDNGMVFGSSRGDVEKPGSDGIDRNDRAAWVHHTAVTIGTEGQGTTLTTPTIKGSVYGSGENGHTYQNTSISIHSGTIGVHDGSNNDAYRGNVYGGGCGTDKYDSNNDDIKDAYNKLSGIVRGTTTILIDGGKVMHNVYGAGAMGSVGTTDISDSGTTSITISGGIVGYDGNGNGNVFGAARGATDATSNEYAIVLKNTNVTVSGGTINGNVYGGGELGCVGRYVISNDMRNFYWTNTPLASITPSDPTTFPYNNTGVCNVNVTGSTASIKGHVFGGGKGKEDTFWCEKGIAYKTNVTITNGTVDHNVYGGGQVGRVETDATVMIGPDSGTGSAEIKGDVFGAGAGVETHGYSALVRGNTYVTIQSGAKVHENVYGGGELAAVGKYYLVDQAYLDSHPETALEIGMPYSLASENLGVCNVTVKGSAEIGYNGTGHLYGGGKGKVPSYYLDNTVLSDTTQMPKRMMSYNSAVYNNNADNPIKDLWGYTDASHQYVWEYFDTRAKYHTFLETLALATRTVVSVEGSAKVNGSVYGGSQSGFVQHNTSVTIKESSTIGKSTGGTVTGGDVYGGGLGLEIFDEAGRVSGNSTVNINGGNILNSVYGGGAYGIVRQNVTVNVSGGTVTNDVYGGGALANTNTDNWDSATETLADNSYSEATGLTTGTSSVTGLYTRSGSEGSYTYTLITDVTAKAASGTTYYENAAYKTIVSLTGGKVGNAYGGGLGRLASSSVSEVAAMVYGDVTVTVDGTVFHQQTESEKEAVTYKEDNQDITTKVTKYGRVFGANNVNGTPKGNILVHVKQTVPENGGEHEYDHYEIHSVYGGGNQADYLPVSGRNTQVLIEDCGATSIQYVYGGGNSASVPQTLVTVNGCFEIGMIFGGGNGEDPVQNTSGVWEANPGADVKHSDETAGTGTINAHGGIIRWLYGGSNKKGLCGTITENLKSENPACPLKITNVYGAGKNADVEEVFIVAKCPGENVEYLYGGSYNAHITRGVTLTLIGGQYKNVYGGNDSGGTIGGDIKVNIQETLGCAPIIIDNLYGGGNNAEYPGNNGTGGSITVNVKSCTYIGNIYGGGRGEGAIVNGNTAVNINMTKGLWASSLSNQTFTLSKDKADFEGKTPAQIKTALEAEMPNIDFTNATFNPNYTIGNCKVKNEIGTIGNIYGGGDEASVNGSTTVNIGNVASIDIMQHDDNGVPVKNTGTTDNPEYTPIFDDEGKLKSGFTYDDIAYISTPVLGANITGNVFGGGNLANVTGITNVNICADDDDDDTEYTAVSEGAEGVTIRGSVYGGGKGRADNFECDKAMVGTNDHGEKTDEGNTYVRIGNGTVGGNVYGGGKVGRVESHTNVTIGYGDGVASGSTPISAPVITGYVFGAGEGVATHGYSGLVRGNSTVTIQGNAEVGQSVYGGGQKATVGRFWVKNVNDDAYEHKNDYPNVPTGMPYARMSGGACSVTVQGYAEIGPDDMQMPTFSGHVFGAGKGLTPYVDTDTEAGSGVGQGPGRWYAPDGVYTWQSYAGDNKESDYLGYIQTLALADATDVTIAGHAFIKGSVYGGSENGRVLDNTDVKIQEYCQIGNGWNNTANEGAGAGVNRLYNDTEWGYDVTTDATKFLYECNSWPYTSPYAPYDKFNYGGGSSTASDGHTFYGNVFGGGSGYFPYASGKWHSEAGAVGGNTTVTITGGHILTSVYGGNELTDVTGSCTVNFGGTATLGVPRTLTQIANHPVTCYLFGAGKGDQRTHFNTWTNVNSATVNVTGGIIYGSVFGGGEDGHVLDDVVMTINETDYTTDNSNTRTKIGTWGTSYVDGNVFGGGRGFSGEAQTAGTVGGNVTVTISGGTMLGSIYGGGRLASVGTYFTAPNANEYGQLKEDGNGKTYGHITLNIYGGTIGGGKAGSADDLEAHRYDMGYSGNVYGGCMGRITQIDGVTINPIWPELAQSKFSTVNIYGNNTHITRNVYGGAEFGVVRENAKVTIGGKQEETGTTITEVSTPTVDGYVYGGGHGSDDYQHPTTIEVYWGGTQRLFTYTPMQWTGCVGGNTTVNLAGGSVKRIYGGGELASVGVIDYGITENANGEFTYKDKKYSYTNLVKHESLTNGFGLSWPYKFTYVPCNPTGFIGGLATVNVTGGTVTEYVYGGGQGKVAFTGVNDIEQQRYTEAFCANVKETQVTIGKSDSDDTPVIGPGSLTSAASVYGGGEDGHVLEDASVIINKGTIGHSVFGGGKGVSTYTATLLDPTKDTPTPKGSSESVHSWTAGKVYGNTNVTMNGGSVGWFIYGGGNMASVGKGNYTGGSDDYSTGGYGETITGNLWTSAFDPNEAVSESNKPDDAYYFLSSGKATVNLFGGTVGDADATAETAFTPTDKLPYGSVFGGSRGTAAMDVDDKSPRYKYVPDSYCGYVNKTVVNIGGTTTDGAVAGDGPTILGSVYGGAQDGHVRNSTEVRIFKGKIDGRSAELDAAGRSGHVFGAGSGIGTYGGNKVSYSSGSVTCTTLVEMNGGSIHGNIWGGGAMASVGPQMIGSKNEQHAVTEGSDHKSVSYTRVDVKGGSVGGNVYGASRGPSDAYLTTIFGSAENYDKTKFATDIWSFVNVTGGTVSGSVYGGGEGGIVKHDTEVSLTGGTITNDAYGGGKGTKHIDANVNGNTTVELNKELNPTDKGCIVNRIFGCNDYKGTPKGHVLVHVYATQNKDADKTTIADKFVKDDVNLNSVSDVTTLKGYLKDYIKLATKLNISVTSYEDTYNNESTAEQVKTAITTIASAIKTAADTDDEINDIKAIRYDVAAVYGGGNLAPYEPYGPAKNETPADYKATEERTEVIIDGCQLTSIKQVYGGGNAAPVPASYLEVNGTYEIDEAFGGGNGADEYEFDNKWYQNPGANVGYYNYTTVSTTTEGHDGSTKAKAYPAVENTDAATKELRQQNYSYGSGIATTEIKGGKIHNVYGGSNKKGNISTTALSLYESMYDDCPIDVDESYGGGKDAPIDGNVDLKMECAHGVKEMFGGAKNADVNSDINLTITNGSSLERVFGGNNTSGAITGSITVNIEEGGCEPIRIGELYAGGYLAPYSIYGYEEDGQGGFRTKDMTYEGVGTIAQRIPLTDDGWESYKTLLNNYIEQDEAKLENKTEAEIAASEELRKAKIQLEALRERLSSYPKKDPRINVISATSIGNIYGGGYQAMVVGSPHINVNMTNGKVEVENKGTGDTPNWQDANGTSYTSEPTTTYSVTVDGERVEVERVPLSSVTLPEAYNTNDYKETVGSDTYVYKNGDNFYKVANIHKKYWVSLPIGEIGNIYGGGNLADIVGNTYVEIGTGKWLTWDDQGNPVWETTDASGNKYTSKQTGNAVNYTQAECSKQNAGLRGYIPSGVKLSAEQASAVNTALELTGENVYVADNVIYTEDAALYNAKLSGFWTTAKIKTPAEYYTQAEITAAQEGDDAYGKTTSDVKTPAVYYTQAECNEHNKTIAGYIACTTALTAKQAVAVNEAISANYASGDKIYMEDAAAYIATLNGHISTTDVKTPAAWTWYNESDTEQDSTPTPARKAAKITGNVFGGGKGKADTFQCEKAMVGVDGDGIANPDGGTNVTIANGTVGTLEDGKLKAGTGNVYGGGMIGRVEKNTMVTIGVEANDAPVIYGDVFGAGQGVETHGYSALVRGNPTVIIQSNSKVLGSVYGGGEVASVARYKVVGGSPVALANKTSGNCKVIIRGDAEIGPDNMQMYHTDGSGNIVANDKPDDTGHIFGAGKGVLPKIYSYADSANMPKRMLAYDPTRDTESNKDLWGFTDDSHQNIWQYFPTEAEYLGYIETLALSSKTDVTIGGNAFVKGSVYGGSLNGIVQYNTHVTIEGDCQIGQGQEITTRYKEFSGGNIFESNTPPIKSGSVENNDAVYYDLECAHWDYDNNSGATYDEYAKYLYEADGKYYYDAAHTLSARDGSYIAKDGHTYYGNVFGGGSGVIPYAPGKWHRASGVVRGNTVVDITGGHILTNIYGGNEHTDVGIYDKDFYNNNEPTIPKSGGLCTVNFGGTATLGVPRTLEQIAAHPVTCYLFGSGKGDMRTFFNTWTNIREAEVNITGGKIYGSVFGGGEDGHVIENVTVNIDQSDYDTDTDNTQTLIGTTGTSYVDGNVFGAGRGYSGEAITAGSVGGNVTVNISGGTMLGSVYGGGRLASVGIGFNAVTNSHYGQYTEDGPVKYTQAECDSYNTTYSLTSGNEGYRTTNDIKIPEGKTFGHVTVNINGGTIGHEINFKDETNNHTTGGNVFGGSMGRLELLGGEPNPLWPQLGLVKTATVNITGGTIKSNVYGGGELGTVRDNTTVDISGGIVERDVYGGGYGSSIIDKKNNKDYTAIVETKDQNNNTMVFGYNPMKWAGCVGKGTTVNVRGGRVKKSVYGGGEMASVGIINYLLDETEYDTEAAVPVDKVLFRKNPTTNKFSVYKNLVKHADETNSFALSWPYELPYFPGYEGKTNITITGGRIGLTKAEDDLKPYFDKDNGDVYGGGKGIAGDFKDYLFCANVGSSEVTINYPTTNTATPTNYMYPTSNEDNNPMVDCVAGALYGGAENGHVIGDTKVTLTNGLIGHSLYGGGSGKGQFKTMLTMIPEGRRNIVTNTGSGTAPEKDGDKYEATCYSITAGKVFGNTNVEMTGGIVIRNIYGGGNMGSVGKGNYAGGSDDYSTAGYGETLNGNNDATLRTLWDGNNPFSEAFLNSGKCTVKVTGGTIGYIASDPNKSMYPLTTDPQTKEKIPYDASLPYGNVFGGCRGESAPNILETPRYLYSPEFFVGYANETEVIIGTSGQSSENAGSVGNAPLILGSVYGGGQDGHIRRDAEVTVYSGEIGKAFTYENRKLLKTIPDGTTEDEAKAITSDLDNLQWLARGNVYGAGSGIGKYKYDFNYDGDFSDEVDYTAPYTDPEKKRTSRLLEEDYSTSAGSVTRFTTVTINGGKIHRNVYGGGSLSTVGAPVIGQTYLPYRKGDTADGHGVGKQSLNRVNIASTIGTHDDYQAHYGGEVYGASRGIESLDDRFSNAVWTEVNIKDGANIQGNVFGGGDNGPVKQDTEVNIGVEFSTTAPTSLDKTSAAISETFTITTDGNWEVYSNASWLTVSKNGTDFSSHVSGKGEGADATVTVTAAANTGTAARTATITITGAGDTKTIKVTQRAPSSGS